MAKITITMEDLPEGLIIVGDPSMSSLFDKAKARQPLTVAESMALAAWSAIASQAAQLGSVHSGEVH